ncbi:NAD(P)H-dependent flavin oxidoreductase [Paenibacillus chartarius]|uniref:Probable nitronate monooxygenase n=1 Tax=Paenibacillus chartarius TaxID=747481 RepID=A0ABV6DUM9_9BACL
MWPSTEVTKQLKITYPIIQAGMAGGSTTPALVAAVSNAGGLGTLGAGYMTPEEIRLAIRQIRELTDRPFAVNLFMDQPYEASTDQIAQVQHWMKPFRDELGIDVPQTPITKYAENADEQTNVVLEEGVPVFSFTFGCLSKPWAARFREAGTVLIGTATTVREAELLEENGVDMVIAQGSEAGGHRGTFTVSHEQALIGTMALVPQIVDAVRIPVIAAGGIMDGRGILAARMLGASAVSLGTAFLTAEESGIHPAYKEKLLQSKDGETVITSAFSGKPARGLKNRFIAEMAAHQHHVPDYPVQNALTRDIRQAAAKQNRTEFMSMWAGQGAPMSNRLPAEQIMQNLVSQVEKLRKDMLA